VVGSVTLLSVISVLSYNVWEDYRLLGMNFNEFTEALYDKLFLPMAGLLVALFTGWFMHQITAPMSFATTPLVRTLAQANAVCRGAGGGGHSRSRVWSNTVMLMTVVPDWLWSYVLIGALLIVGAAVHVGSRGCRSGLFRRTFAVLSQYRVARF
jgi:hypothetical protein